MIIQEDEYLEHYGTPRRSGRYPWGSGNNLLLKKNKDFMDMVESMKAQGLSDEEIMTGLGMKSPEFRAKKTAAKNLIKNADINAINRWHEKGLSNTAIGERLGIPESTVRLLSDPAEQEKAAVLKNVAMVLKQRVDEDKYIDVGLGTEYQMNLSESKRKAAISMLEDMGYTKHYIQIPQLGTQGGQKTSTIVLAGPGVTYSEVSLNRGQIKQFTGYYNESGRTYFNIVPPISIHPDRVDVVYKEQGGDKADGVIFVRPGIPDVSLGGNRYAQVRIKVGDGHYLKGMAVYKEGLPPGKDLVFNTNKPNTGSKFDVMKPLKDDPDNPFGSQISRQIIRIDEKGIEHPTSVMNLVNEQGEWREWSTTLSSQVLSKQSPDLAKQQLAMRYEARVAEYDRISALTNPAVRRKLLISFGDACDHSAAHLEAAALPRTSNHVILPLENIKEGEVFAPNFRNGERIVLIRHPHGGKFEIPELTVNNRNPEGRKLIGPDSQDAIGIHPNVAKRLSGADFDGDTVLAISNVHKKISTSPALEGLKDFDPQSAYPKYPGMPKLKEKYKQKMMGDVSNLITDMTIKGASNDEIVRAVRHSMVVIDAEKHDLNYKQSALDNGIAALKEKYQGGPKSGASTIISRAKSEERVLKRKDRRASLGGPIDKETGKRVYEVINQPWQDKKGKIHDQYTVSTKMAETDDARTLSSGLRIENIYADHANRLKTLANRARKEGVNTPGIVYNASANRVYEAEVKSLDAKLARANANRPRERQAQIMGNEIFKAKKRENPGMTDEQEKKYKYQALAAARARYKLPDSRIKIEPKEWEAIQAGAIHNNRLLDILENTDVDKIKDLATPKITLKMPASKAARAKTMLSSGYTRSEVADHFGVSLSTLDLAIKEG